MDFELSEEQLMFRRVFRDFVANEIAPLVDEAEEKEEFPVELFPKMGKLGYLSVAYPVEYGGGGMGKLGECIEHEELACVCLGIGSGIAAHSTLAGSILCYHSSEEQRNKYFIPAMKGEKITGFAITEPNAGSDMAAIETKAIRQGEDYLLNGNKIFTSNGPIADFVLVAAYTDKSKVSRWGMSVFIVEKGIPGFTVSRKLKKLGLRSEETGELVFENCRVPAENLVGEEGKGWQYIRTALNGTRLPYAARALGLAEAAYEAALEYAKNRVQFGQPIGKFQAIGFKLARMAMEIEAARWLIYHAAWLYDQGKECVKEVSVAKLFSSEMVLHVVDEAAHIFGGYGFMMEFPIQRYLRDARLCPIGLGSSEIQEMIIARRIGL